MDLEADGSMTDRASDSQQQSLIYDRVDGQRTSSPKQFHEY